MKKLIYLFLSIPNLFFSQTINWVPLSSEISGDFVNELSVYNNKLIACGRFTSAGTVSANVIAAWDGSSWSNLGGGFRKDDIGYTTITFNNELYLGGYFDSIGNTKVKHIAKWNGTSWSSLGTGADDAVWDLCVYNNELYASGTFSVIGGVSAKGIARWDGTNWNALGNGLTNFGARDFCIYNNSLYVVGFFNITGCPACHNIASWNGSNWTGVATNGIPSANVALIEWNSKLLTGSNAETSPPTFLTEIRQWDGTSLSMFSKQNSVAVQKFYIFNNELYCSGGGGPAPNGASLVSKWSTSTSTWIPVGTGPNQYVTGMVEYNGELYCSGMFNTLQQSNLNFIGRLTNVNGLNDLAKDKEINIFPNPAQNKINICDHSYAIKSINLTDIVGQFICNYEPESNEIDISKLAKGVYFLNIQGHQIKKSIKIIKE